MHQSAELSLFQYWVRYGLRPTIDGLLSISHTCGRLCAVSMVFTHSSFFWVFRYVVVVVVVVMVVVVVVGIQLYYSY